MPVTVEFGEEDHLVMAAPFRPGWLLSNVFTFPNTNCLTGSLSDGQHKRNPTMFALLRDEVNLHRFTGLSENPQETLQIRIEFSKPVTRAFPVMLLVRCVKVAAAVLMRSQHGGVSLRVFCEQMGELVLK